MVCLGKQYRSCVSKYATDGADICRPPVDVWWNSGGMDARAVANYRSADHVLGSRIGPFLGTSMASRPDDADLVLSWESATSLPRLHSEP